MLLTRSLLTAAREYTLADEMRNWDKSVTPMDRRAPTAVLALMAILSWTTRATGSMEQKPPGTPVRSPAGRPSTARTYIDHLCGIKFAYPAVWTITTGEAVPEHPAENICSLELTFQRKVRRGPLVSHSVTIFVSNHEFTGIENEDRFFQRDDKWYEFGGASGNPEAKEVRGANWIGRNMPDGGARCYGERYRGLGHHPRAVLYSQVFRRMVELDGGECELADGEGIEIILHTMEFIPISDRAAK